MKIKTILTSSLLSLSSFALSQDGSKPQCTGANPAYLIIAGIVIAILVIIIIVLISKNKKTSANAPQIQAAASGTKAFVTLANKDYEVSENGINIGRGEISGISLEDSTVSHLHARIYVENGFYYIADLGSKNGTYVNDKQITREMLKNGDTIKTGETSMQFKTEQA